eukprot:sb/3473365/
MYFYYKFTTISPPPGVGYARTGTYSLKHALATLGLRCYHFEDMFTTPGHAAIWARWIRDGADEATAPWRYLLRGYDAVVDFPHVLFAGEIAVACPGAVVVLTKRGNSEEWVRSMEHLLETGGMIKKYRSILWWISRFSEEFITITDYKEGVS